MTKPLLFVSVFSVFCQPHWLLASTLVDCSQLEVSARTHDGEIMGMRHREFAKSHAPLEGVQFHPESIVCTEGKRLLKNFLQLARRVGQP